MQISKKGRSRQVATVRESSDHIFLCTVSRDRCLWTVERGGRCIQVVVKTGFTVVYSIEFDPGYIYYIVRVPITE